MGSSICKGPARGGSRVACLNLKMSRVAVLSHFTSLSVVELKGNCLSLSEFKFFHKGCCLSRFYFMRCRYFLGHVACWNLPWQGLYASDLHVTHVISHSYVRTLMGILTGL